MQSLYEILSVPETASIEEIHKAYKKLALKFHPDKFVGADSEEMEKITERFQEIAEAYRRLSDEKSRESYDRIYRLRRFNMTMEPVDIAGLITHPRPPFSLVFRKMHEKNAQCMPAMKRKNRFIPEKPDFQGKGVKESAISFIEKKLTPNLALEILQNFLEGHYQGVQNSLVRNYLQEQVLLFSKMHPEKKITLGLYQGIINILEPDSKAVYPALQKILKFAQAKAETEDVLCMSQFFRLFALKNFQQLTRHAMKEYFANQSLGIFAFCFESSMDMELANDIRAEKDPFLHLLYNIQQRLKAAYLSAKNNPELLRKLAFDFLDYIQLVNEDRMIVINQVLLTCALLQQTSRMETNPRLRAADEHLIIQLSIVCMRLARKRKAFEDIYAHQHLLYFLHGLHFEHPNIVLITAELSEHLFGLLDFFPFLENMKSHLDLNNSLSIQYLQKYLKTLTFAPFSYRQSDIYWQAFDASMKEWYTQIHDSEQEELLRLKAMGHFLVEKDWTFLDMEKNLSYPWVMVDRDKEGWLTASNSLPFMDGMNTYQSIDGLDIDFKTGEIYFARKPWTTQDAPWKKRFTDYDMEEIFSREIYAAVFSLDPLNGEKSWHPLQQMRYAPESLRNSELLNTLFLTDYLLKFFTTGYEVMGKFPYEIRPIDTLIQNLPAHLKKIIVDFQRGNSKGKIHRFWIEANTLPALKNSSKERLQMSFGEMKISVKKHRMVIDSSGNLVDCKKDREGWNLYYIPNDGFLLPKNFEVPAMIFIQGKETVFLMEQDRISHPFTVTLSDELKKQLEAQKLEADYRIGNSENKNPVCPHFIWELTRFVCEKMSIPHHFSAERIFAEEFTAHYQEFAQYFPEFGRFQQLASIVAVASFLREIYLQKLKEISSLEGKINNPEFLKQIKTSLYQSVYAEALKNFSQLKIALDGIVVKTRIEKTAQLQKMRQELGSFVYHAHSPEVQQIIREHQEKARLEITQKHGAIVWEEVKTTIQNNFNGQIPQIVQQLNQQGQKVRSNYSAQLRSIYQMASPQSIENFLDGNIKPLVDTLVIHQRTQEIEAIIKAYANDATRAEVQAAFDGNPAAMAGKIAEKHSSRLFEEEKKSLQVHLQSLLRLKSTLEKLHFKPERMEENNPSNTCNLVPASFYHGKTSMVYGGDQIFPSVETEIEASRHISNLRFPRTSVFEGTQSIEVKNALDFAAGLRRQISKAALTLGLSATFSMSALADEIERAARQVPFQAPVKTVNLDYGFRNTEIKDLPIITILGGVTHETKFKYLEHDSVECKLLKARANDIINDEQVAVLATNPIQNLRAADDLKNLIEKEIPKLCNPVTAEDLEKMQKKSFLKMSPSDLGNFIWRKKEKTTEEKSDLDYSFKKP